ncbi:hypothetical protein AAFC00_001117 [Neodothiora populina]|uniref:COP9 signalosome complex subunit 3 n=1 Tax=Neodothiora populina TaxID=2781224 RepID=A0ABR3PN51_9PEZI
MSDDLVSNLLFDVQPSDATSPDYLAQYDANLKKLVKYTRQANERDLAQNVQGSNLLALLHPTRNTISYLAVLLALKNLALRTRQVLPGQVDCTITFLASFDPTQARYVGQELRELIGWLPLYYEQTGDASVTAAVGSAILQLDPESSTFTSTHLLFVRLCLAASLPRQALSVLDKDIYNFPTEPIKGVDDSELCAEHQSSATYITRSSGLSADIAPADVQEYYLLGAHVYIGLRQWSRARLFLELVLASPTAHVATPLMVEAYKKLILVALLSSGQSFSAKGLVDQATQKTLSALSKGYEALGHVFRLRDLQRFYAEVDTGAQYWADDGNTALVNQVAESLRRYRVSDLQLTFSALPLDRIATHLSLGQEATMSLLTSMIRDGHIRATITQPTQKQSETSRPVLRFLSHNPDHTPIDLNQHAVLATKYQAIERLAKHVKEADRRLAISREYVEYVRRSKRAEGAGAPGYEDPMEESWDAPAGGSGGDADEDMMGDLR